MTTERQTPKLGLTIGTKLAAISIVISMAAVCIAAVLAGYSSNEALKRAAFERLTAVRELKAQQIESYFSQVENELKFVAESASLKDNLQQLRRGIVYLQVSEDLVTPEYQDDLNQFYLEDFRARYEEETGTRADDAVIDGLLPQDPLAIFLQHRYILDPQLVNQVQFETQYGAAVSALEQSLGKFQDRFGFYDVFLIEPNDGRIVYSVEREIDFGTSVFDGPYSNTNLARAVTTAMAANPDQVIFADFESYIPSFNAPAAFAALPVYDGPNPIGVLAVQLPLSGINAIMTSNQSWSDVGLGDSGEAYIVGRDKLLRNQSRFLIEDREEYLKLVGEVGLPSSIIDQIERTNSSVGLQEVDTIGTQAALSGRTGTEIFPDYRNVEVLSSYRPLELSGLDWVIMSEIDREEALRDADQLIDRLILVASIVLAIAIYASYLFSISLTRPLRLLSGSAARLTAGELDEPIKVQTSDEIGELAQNFEALRLSIVHSLEEVENQKSMLETTVAARTTELNEASAQLQLALSKMSNGIYMLDADMNYVLVNERYTEMLALPPRLVEPGQPEEEVIRWHAENGDYGLGDTEQLIRTRLEALADGHSSNVVLNTAAGRTIEIRTTPISGGGLVGVVTDITTIKRNEAELVAQNENLKKIQGDLAFSEQRISKIIEASPIGILSIDRKGTIETFSSAAEQIFGYYASDVIGKNLKILMETHVAVEHDLYLERRIHGASSTVVGQSRVVNAVRKDGSVFKLEARVEEVQVGDEIFYIGLVEDITERLELERQAEEAREQAERANEAKSAFLANMSHELRTPMNAIIGYSEMMAEDAEDDGLEEMLGDLNKITNAGKHLLSLINDVLDLSKIEAGKMDMFLEDFAVKDITEDVASTALSLIEKNANELVLDIDQDLDTMYGDVTKVRQILFNLISNAAKFTKEGKITLSANVDSIANEPAIRFAVTDTGIGIPEDKIEHIFAEFSQADESTTRDYGGTGLGLALVKRFCEMMGGSIRVESTIGQGSSFIVTLPKKAQKKHEGLEEEARISGATSELASSDEDATPTSTESIKDTFARKSVLVIDDEASARELLKKRLEAEGCSVVLAKSGAEGLALAAEHLPVLITLDVMMPGMDGWTVLRRLKADNTLKDIPVVMISMVGDKAMSYSLGAVESLQKPVDRGKLSGLVKKYASGGQKTTLVVEDDPAARETMVRTLQGDGWEVDEAENGKIALGKTEQHEFELILLDLMMPVMDGFEFLERLRSSDHPSANTPIIIVTAMELNTEDRKRLQTSVSDVVQKSGGDVEGVLEEILSLIHR
ncbi:response regulator [Tateyamaria pelophila]|uniref:response regulator n=1 Tax=Tateyamaria pelophila TaxID=328415 RepID=UPI001CBED92C|nr:response regulator [Tateyamaria pelophila]